MLGIGVNIICFILSKIKDVSVVPIKGLSVLFLTIITLTCWRIVSKYCHRNSSSGFAQRKLKLVLPIKLYRAHCLWILQIHLTTAGMKVLCGTCKILPQLHFRVVIYFGPPCTFCLSLCAGSVVFLFLWHFVYVCHIWTGSGLIATTGPSSQKL